MVYDVKLTSVSPSQMGLYKPANQNVLHVCCIVEHHLLEGASKGVLRKRRTEWTKCGSRLTGNEFMSNILGGWGRLDVGFGFWCFFFFVVDS